MVSIWDTQHNLGTHDIKTCAAFCRDAHIPSEEWAQVGHRLGTSAQGAEEERRL